VNRVAVVVNIFQSSMSENKRPACVGVAVLLSDRCARVAMSDGGFRSRCSM
jgi:hypothetical protein